MKPGIWHGPTTTAITSKFFIFIIFIFILSSLINLFHPYNIYSYVVYDNTIYQDKLEEFLALISNESREPENNNNNQSRFKPLLFMIPIRLGIKQINPIYYSALGEFFKFKTFVGCIGGVSSSSYYFVGHENKESGTSI